MKNINTAIRVKKIREISETLKTLNRLPLTTAQVMGLFGASPLTLAKLIYKIKKEKP